MLMTLRPGALWACREGGVVLQYASNELGLFFSSRRRHTRYWRDWSSDVCSSDLGLPTSVPGVTVNRLCGSGAEAVVGAARAVECGDASLTIAGGVESMSRAPWVLPK